MVAARNRGVANNSVTRQVARGNGTWQRQFRMFIRIIVTGGTFDKEYDELNGRLFFRQSHVEEMLRRGRCRLDVTIETAMMVDSLDLDDEGRQRIVDRCRAAREREIVVTHGTDTMVETARALAAASLGKTIVLTGAMVPYAFGSSDGLFNLGSALSFAQILAPGVYIAMNGKHFRWDAVRKNTASGVFEEFP
jgi:L-asparaginase